MGARFLLALLTVHLAVCSSLHEDENASGTVPLESQDDSVNIQELVPNFLGETGEEDVALNLVLRGPRRPATQLACDGLDPAIVQEIAAYQPVVDSIINFVMDGAHKGVTYSSLATFVDTFGPRMTGGNVLETAIDTIVSMAESDGFDDVRTEDVSVPHWVRNFESAFMVTPRVMKLNMLGLGGSIGTPDEGISAEVVVVETFKELESLDPAMVVGKIVVYNQEFINYGTSVQYRSSGAVAAARLGAIAALVRSVTDFSINSPHTGGMNYDDEVTKIPTASITVEDAKLLHRLYSKGETVTVNLTMGAMNYPNFISRNTIIDHHGTDNPHDVVVVSGHIDSWDVGAGAMDDAGGCFVGYHANLVLKKLGLRPRRTVRTIFFTGEEQGLYGGFEFFNRHKNESENYQVLMESDLGTFNPRGIGFSGSDTATCIMQEIVKLTAAINTTELIVSNDGPDIGIWTSIGVPIGSLNQDPNNYFWYHHSDGDRLEVEDPDTLDKITALWATVAYVAADITTKLQEV